MIHVFTATGNSLQIGRALAERTGQKVTFINAGGSADDDVLPIQLHAAHIAPDVS